MPGPDAHADRRDAVRRALLLLLRAGRATFEPLLADAVTSAHLHEAAVRVLIRALTLRFAAGRGMLSAANHTTWAGIVADMRLCLGRVSASEPVMRLIAGFEAESVLDEPTVAEWLALLGEPRAWTNLDIEVLGGIYESLLDDELQEAEPPLHWQLVRKAETRKRAGSFYTPPALAEPTVRRTLRPLTHAGEQVHPPARLLALRVCDPAMGGGSFLLAALRVLTEVTWESLRVHGHIEAAGAQMRVRLADEPEFAVATFERDARRWLAGLIAARCLYGVDLDPLAVDLARLSIWLAVGDPSPHAGRRPNGRETNLRCGNALIGCWLERAHDYPLLAWAREGDPAIAARRRAIKADLVTFIESGEAPIREPPTRAQLDTWCALWFWPADAIASAPTPRTFHSPDPDARACVEALADTHRFLHWQLEFPEVFAGSAPGFDAIVGNPPWDIQKPNSKEFFARVEPRYRELAKQDALRWQKQAFADDDALARAWAAEQAGFCDLSNYIRHVGAPFGDPGTPLGRRGSAALHDKWRALRAAPQPRPFRRQGVGDVNAYKLFVELAYTLTRPGGRLGLVVPSGLYTDKGCAELRELLLAHCRWEWLFGFENRHGIFAIHRSFKFAVVIAEVGGATEQLQAAFMQHDPQAWAAARPPATVYPRARIREFSPSAGSILELTEARELDLLHTLYRGNVTLGEPSERGWQLRYATELHMTADAHRFAAIGTWAARGYRADEYGHWLRGRWRAADPAATDVVRSADQTAMIDIADIEDVALPIYEGRMIGQFDHAAKAWVSGRGRRAVWRELEHGGDKHVGPQFAISAATLPRRATRLGFMDVSSATNQRTMIATLTSGFPHGNKVPVLRCDRPIIELAALTAALNSFVFDFVLRRRLVGQTLNWFIVEDACLPAPGPWCAWVGELALGLACPASGFAREWLAAAVDRTIAWRRHWALTRAERLRRRCMIDAILAWVFGLSVEDYDALLADCDLGVGFDPRGRAPKGFWRIDKDQPAHLRHTVLSQLARRELERVGIATFVQRGWQLPEQVRLADHGLGHDALAQRPQPVAAVLGPLAQPWQLELDAAMDWAACERHAQRLERLARL